MRGNGCGGWWWQPKTGDGRFGFGALDSDTPSIAYHRENLVAVAVSASALETEDRIFVFFDIYESIVCYSQIIPTSTAHLDMCANA